MIDTNDILTKLNDLMNKNAFVPTPGGQVGGPQQGPPQGPPQQGPPPQGAPPGPNGAQQTLQAAAAIGGAPNIQPPTPPEAPAQPETPAGGDTTELSHRIKSLESTVHDLVRKNDERLNPELDQRLHLIEEALSKLLEHSVPKTAATNEDVDNFDKIAFEEVSEIGKIGPSGSILDAPVGGFNVVKPVNNGFQKLSQQIKRFRNET